MHQHANLLIVDDERGPMESLRMIFKPSYNVYTASGGPQALELVEREPIDVVTLDLKMPDMSGIEVMERIKQHDPDIEVIIVTGYSSLDTAIRGLRFRAFDYVSKPFDVNEISDLVQRAVAQRRARQRIRKMKDDFLANLSHELRTPLSAIIGYSDILSEELNRQVSPDLRLALSRIQSNSHDLLKLIEGVLLLNSLDAGELAFSPERVDAVEAVRRVAQRYEAMAVAKDLQLDVDIDIAALPLESDEHQLERVLAVLIENAIKFTETGRVFVTARRDATDTIEIRIIDTGVGMAAAEHRRAIEGLSQVDASSTRRHRGLGLGLRIATRLVTFLGGTLEMHSEKGKGTEVFLRLPVHARQDPRSASGHA